MIKTKYRSSLKTGAIDMLMRINLNEHLACLDSAAKYFVDTKQSTFENYVNLKSEAKKQKCINFTYSRIILSKFRREHRKSIH